jgi:hypothetical protein
MASPKLARHFYRLSPTLGDSMSTFNHEFRFLENLHSLSLIRRPGRARTTLKTDAVRQSETPDGLLPSRLPSVQVRRTVAPASSPPLGSAHRELFTTPTFYAFQADTPSTAVTTIAPAVAAASHSRRPGRLPPHTLVISMIARLPPIHRRRRRQSCHRRYSKWPCRSPSTTPRPYRTQNQCATSPPHRPTA